MKNVKNQNPLNFPRFLQLKRQHLFWDLHMHTNYVDGKNSIAEMLSAAQAKGVELLAITEHVRTSFENWWLDYVREIKELRGNTPKVLIGMEANAIGFSGNVDVTENMWLEAEIVLGAVHGYYDDSTWDRINHRAMRDTDALRYEINKLEGLCDNFRIHILAHPFWLYRKYYGQPPAWAVEKIAKKAVETGTAYELNCEYEENNETLDILREYNPLVSVGSNAHDVSSIGVYKLRERLGL